MSDIRKNPRLRTLAVAACLALFCSVFVLPARTQDRGLKMDGSAGARNSRRVALVIGNGAYEVAPLKNPVNDARGVAEALRSLGFEVTQRENLSQNEMKRAVREFGQRSREAGIRLFYYAGHGMQVNGENYLIPVGTAVSTEQEVEYESVNVGLVLAQMEDSLSSLNIVILDACRNNPFARSFRSSTQGLAQMKAPTGTLLAYATAPGQVASDGSEGNGLYTQELLRHMRTPGLSVEEVFKRVRISVLGRTQGRQTPWESSSLTGDFYFIIADKVTISPNTQPSAPSVDPAALELAFWDSIKASTDPEDFRDYLKRYPAGQFAGLAQRRVAALTAGTKVRLPANNATPANTLPAVSTPARPAAGATARPRSGIELVYVPAGSFMMGSSDAEIQRALTNAQRYTSNARLDWFKGEGPQHQVTIRDGFYMGRYEVTQAQWQAVMGNNPSSFKGCDTCPVEMVSWNDAQEFLKKLNAMNDGYTYRLPTEAEWEYAARAGTTTQFAFGNSLGAEQANFDGNYPYGGAAKGVFRESPTPVGSFQANGWGLYDMHGNVYEWCADTWHESYDGAPTDGTAWLSGGESKYRVIRGGPWNGLANFLRSAYRSWRGPEYGYDYVGFRVVAVSRL